MWPRYGIDEDSGGFTHSKYLLFSCIEKVKEIGLHSRAFKFNSENNLTTQIIKGFREHGLGNQAQNY